MSNAQRDHDQLTRLIVARHPCISIVTSEESYVVDLLNVIAIQLSERVYSWSATRGIVDGPMHSKATGRDETENPSAGLFFMAHKAGERRLLIVHDVASHLGDDARHVRALRDAINACRAAGSTLVLIDHADSIPDTLRPDITSVELTLPDAADLESLVRATIVEMHINEPVETRITRSAFDGIIRNLAGLTRSQARQIICDCVAADRLFDADDLQTVIVEKRRRLEHDGVLEFVEAPVSLDSVGGLEHFKQWLAQRRHALDPAAIEFGLTPPRGVLLLGVQGAGKSLSAKAVATAWQRPLLRLDPSRLYDRYVGESERRLRAALHQAEMMAPMVLWIDEIEKGFASAAARSTDGGLSQRMFGALLTWMQEHRAPVFLVATANNIDALPPELLRKGRFDEIFFVDLPDARVRSRIIEIHLRSRDRDPEAFDRDRLAAVAEGFSGAEIEQAIVAAMHDAFASRATLTTERIAQQMQSSPPLSVTMAEAMARLRHSARDRCVPAGASEPQAT